MFLNLAVFLNLALPLPSIFSNGDRGMSSVRYGARLPVVEEQGRTCGGQAKVEALRINLNVEGRLWHSSSSPSASFLSRSPFSLAPTCEKYAEIDVSFFEIF